ncbi:hypothetical protein NL108_012205 [Boleophthalmus pectinirostris]|uniref:zinc finger protein 57-like n=1 Tax=Boleophthalmus pectinirostris TaxID=150288 RepID=UPI000A1C4AEB|nr:zinc finger protein 57-like [Boleophthalmus pectinirostris]XP_055019314.1 zinc finger protein 57-like [Boleophthalmus pectinirostris]KAJ0062446.1 hypothetical protein NL108_012205 [Boleophthalmus pectinirostris]
MFPCSKCGKSYSSSHALRRHLRIHSGERPYSCDFCSKTFTWKHNAKTHIQIHAVKPYDCEICDKQFRSSNELTHHLRKHFDVMPHVCTDCGEGFERPAQLRVHNCPSGAKVTDEEILKQLEMTENNSSSFTAGEADLGNVDERPEDEQ